MNRICLIFMLILIVAGSFYLSVVAHEMMHIVYSMPANISKAICTNLNPLDKSYTNHTMVAYVTQTETDITYTEQHYGIYMSQGIVLTALTMFGTMTVLEVMLPKTVNRPMCFGTKQFSLNQNICRGCDSYQECEKEHEKNHRIVRF